MTSEIERIKILEGKVSRIVDYIHKITNENSDLKRQLKELKAEKRSLEEQAKKASKLDDSLKKYEEERKIVKSKIETIISQIDKLEI